VRQFDRFARFIQANDVAQGQHVRAAQVVIGIRRGKAIQVRTTDRYKHQRIRVRGNFSVQARSNLRYSFHLHPYFAMTVAQKPPSGWALPLFHLPGR
jgi:hypothetical protein